MRAREGERRDGGEGDDEGVRRKMRRGRWSEGAIRKKDGWIDVRKMQIEVNCVRERNKILGSPPAAQISKTLLCSKWIKFQVESSAFRSIPTLIIIIAITPHWGRRRRGEQQVKVRKAEREEERSRGGEEERRKPLILEAPCVVLATCCFAISGVSPLSRA